MSDDRRQGDTYVVTDDDRAAFQRDGYVHLRGVMSEDEMAEPSRRCTTGSCAARSPWRARTSTT